MSEVSYAKLLFGIGVGVLSAAGIKRSSNLRIVRNTFAKWESGNESLFDLMTDDAVIVIPGTVAHCGRFDKRVFLKDVAKPFMSRFSRPPVPRLRKIWSDGEVVAVLADAEGTTRDGRRYANDYVFVLRMRGGRVVEAMEFLDMVAFNEVWDRVAVRTFDPETEADRW